MRLNELVEQLQRAQGHLRETDPDDSDPEVVLLCGGAPVPLDSVGGLEVEHVVTLQGVAL